LSSAGALPFAADCVARWRAFIASCMLEAFAADRGPVTGALGD
jgi:hypothetical protein